MSNQIETTNSINRTFKINIQNISNEYKLQCSIINNSKNKETKIKIYQDDILIKEIKKQYLLPAEMENITIQKELIKNNKPILIEVEQ